MVRNQGNVSIYNPLYTKPAVGFIQIKFIYQPQKSIETKLKTETIKKSATFFNLVPVIQKKLRLGSANDSYEGEADNMANKVMRMPEPSHQNVTHTGALIQKKCAACEQEEKIQMKPLTESITPLIQRSSTLRGEVAPSHVETQINSSRGGGSAMDNSTQSFMERRFGTDFSDVKIHTGSQAVQMSKELNAQAFTVGSDIYFNEGMYGPNSESGKHLLAHELMHTIQQGAYKGKQESKHSQAPLKIYRQDMDAGVSGPRDAGPPAGVPYPAHPSAPAPEESHTDTHETVLPGRTTEPAQATCTTAFRQARNFQQLIGLIRASETRLTAAGISNVKDQVHALRGIYYGTLWSLDYSVEHSTLRNDGFQLFTRPSSANSATTTPIDIRTILDCGLFLALQQSQDVNDGGRHLDFGHLIIGLDARYDSGINTPVSYPSPIPLTPRILLGGTGLELVTWLGDLGGGAATLAIRRVATPSTTTRSVFSGSDYGGSINLEGDIAAFVVATSAAPTAPEAPSFAIGGSHLSDALQTYLSPGTGVSASWMSRATTFLHMYGGVFDANRTLTNRTALVNTFKSKIQVFACNYLTSRTRDGHLDFRQAQTASTYINNAGEEVAGTFVDALIDSHTTGTRIEATRFPTPMAGTSIACSAQTAVGSLFGTLGL